MPAGPLPESCSGLTPLFQGALFAIDDWRCAGHDTPGREEEWCRDDRIVVTRRGVWELHTAGEARLADSTTVLFWNRNGYYRIRHPVSGGDRCTVFRLTSAGTGALDQLGREGRRTLADRARSIDGPSYLLHRRALEQARQAHAGADPMAIEEPALAFLRRMTDAGLAGSVTHLPRAVNRWVDQTRDIIARDFLKPLTFEGIAREVHCSPFHLSRLFRRATGISIYRAVVRLRLREGLERLLDEPSHLSRIALDVGFASHSHFTDAFRAEYGCPPSEARRMGQNRLNTM